MEIAARCNARHYAQVTRKVRCNCLRRILRNLWEYHGAKLLVDHIPHVGSIRPRCVTASRNELDALIDAAGPTLQLLLLMCSDLAIRSGTAVQIRPSDYNKERKELRFRTKYDEKVGLPVTAVLVEIFESCDLSSHLPFITQVRLKEDPSRAKSRKHDVVDPHRLRKELKDLRLSLGIEKRIVLHDLRRTTAVEMFRHTKNLHIVQRLLGHRTLQATLWYLDHDFEPVQIEDLEAIKRPHLVKKELSA
jgi:integrase